MRQWKALVIHHSGGSTHDTVESIRKYHVEQRKYRDIGYHYFMEIDDTGRGHLKHGRPTTEAGAHAGKPWWNSNAIGFCVAGNYTKSGPSHELMNDIAAAVAHILSIHSISPSEVYGHREIKATQCPGNAFPLYQLKQDVKQRMKGR